MTELAFPKQRRVEDAGLLEEVRKQPCVVCGKAAPSDPSHIRTRGSGGPDAAWNVIPKCRNCHRAWGTLGAYRFCLRHPKFQSYLRRLGWKWDGYKLRHPELEKVVPVAVGVFLAVLLYPWGALT